MIKTINIPTLLTLLRIVCIPFIVILFYSSWAYANVAATLIFFIASITDWLDGYLARKLGQETKLGAFLDPVADKMMVACILILLVEFESSIWMTLPAVIIISREIIISSLREWMAELGLRTTVKVSSMGKWKTSAQMLAIACLLYRDEIAGVSMQLFGLIVLYIAVILTLWSMISYLKAAYPHVIN